MYGYNYHEKKQKCPKLKRKYSQSKLDEKLLANLLSDIGGTVGASFGAVTNYFSGNYIGMRLLFVSCYLTLIGMANNALAVFTNVAKIIISSFGSNKVTYSDKDSDSSFNKDITLHKDNQNATVIVFSYSYKSKVYQKVGLCSKYELYYCLKFKFLVCDVNINTIIEQHEAWIDKEKTK